MPLDGRRLNRGGIRSRSAIGLAMTLRLFAFATDRFERAIAGDI
ncbi:secreted protein [Rhodopirellula baltica WH47]|uniref:Secreted protein n=1 Tax=Rhodopirellula baltica WH47 TaxID=991778 RepID=F2AVT2_RHOBT|nr:secreted protein [Rhodopirellula baltica WH47]